MSGSTPTLSSPESSARIPFDSNMPAHTKAKRKRLDSAAGFCHRREITILAVFLTFFAWRVTGWAGYARQDYGNYLHRAWRAMPAASRHAARVRIANCDTSDLFAEDRFGDPRGPRASGRDLHGRVLYYVSKQPIVVGVQLPGPGFSPARSANSRCWPLRCLACWR
jgi:hypothetical protein